jgi:signal peptidase I
MCKKVRENEPVQIGRNTAIKFHVKNILLITFVILALTRMDMYKIKGKSMAGSIEEGKIVLIWKSTKFSSHYENNSIVVFQKKVNEKLTPFIKRIIATPGDTLFVNKEELLIGNKFYTHDEIYYSVSDDIDDNSEPYIEYLIKQSAIKCRKQNSVEANLESIKKGLRIPQSCYFVIGDNPYESMDSRFWGFIHSENIIGKVIAVL